MKEHPCFCLLSYFGLEVYPLKYIISKYLHFLETKGFHIISIPEECKIASSIHLIIFPTVKYPLTPISHTHVSSSLDKITFWIYSIRSENWTIYSPMYIWCRQDQDQFPLTLLYVIVQSLSNSSSNNIRNLVAKISLSFHNLVVIPLPTLLLMFINRNQNPSPRPRPNTSSLIKTPTIPIQLINNFHPSQIIIIQESLPPFLKIWVKNT